MISLDSVRSWMLPKAFSSTFWTPIITLETGNGSHKEATRNERLNKDVLLTARSLVFPASRFKNFADLVGIPFTHIEAISSGYSGSHELASTRHRAKCRELKTANDATAFASCYFECMFDSLGTAQRVQ
jgi:hypothetical protein